jgi:rSAM/selenodomain-associated transferase 1
MNRALAIFAKTPLPGQVKTRLTPPLSPEQGAELYRCMLLDTIARVRTLPVDIFIVYQGDERYFRDVAPGISLIPQDKSCLGCRMAAAFAALGSLGYRARVVIGTDAPDLPLPFIEEAFISLETGSDVVFGPAEDGGYYLVALSGLDGGIFRGISWSTSQVLERSLELSREAGFAAKLLPTWYDVDGFDDLCRPGLADPLSGAPLTRHFIGALGLDAEGSPQTGSY